MSGTTKQTPFSKILIANRGEIALRIMRTARRLGFRVVAVYSTADRDARHVREADEAVHIGDSLPSESYLNIAAIVAAARSSGADAVHPGYGFLAENEDFAAACRDAGLVFIGPSAESIRAMGDKAGAKAIMMKAGVPCVPGFEGDQNESVLAQQAIKLGFPVMIKATAGGGGRGMRLVPDTASFAGLLRSAQSEAKSAFGDATVILERAIVEPRHIEIQVFGDRHGNAIHLGERDCSVQRRHQKLIEEAPSPAVTPELRARMGEVAVNAVRAIGYEGAGTLEFLLDRDGNFYFMEMNTRLQVEHPVTEAITGLDLVELQLRVAAGERLPVAQSDVTFRGHAIEVRVCAEDAAHDFMPQSGRMLRWQAPANVRVETALESGAEISPFYDSMIAKIISHGADRDEARRALGHALDQSIAFGVTTNADFLAACLRHDAFVKGAATTAFISQHAEELRRTRNAEANAALTAGLLFYAAQNAAGTWRRGRALTPSFARPMKIGVGDARHQIAVRRGREGIYELTCGDVAVSVVVASLSENRMHYAISGSDTVVDFLRDGDRVFFKHDDLTVVAHDLTFAPPARADAAASDGKLRAAMNGRVVAVLAQPGTPVVRGQPVVTLEAMKMEHVHVAPVDGVVTAVHVSEGEQVTTNFVVAEIALSAEAA